MFMKLTPRVELSPSFKFIGKMLKKSKFTGNY